MTYIKLYHSIWPLGLSPNAFRAYCALLRFMNTDTWYSNVSMSKLALAVGISDKSVSRGIRELRDKCLLTVTDKHHNGHRLANGYIMTPMAGRYTKVPVAALDAPVTASGFMLYVYLLKCVNRNRRAFPSLSGMAQAVGVTVQTVITQIRELVVLKILNKRNQIKKNGTFGHNLYHLLDIVMGY